MAGAVGAAVLALLALGGCGSEDDAAVTLEQKKSADAQAPKTASAAQRERYVPLLRKYHDQATWPQGYDMTPEHLWDQIAGASGDVILDENSAAGDVAIYNQCAWALKAIDVVKSDKDTTEVRQGLQRSSQLMPGAESFFTQMADELPVGNLETTQSFVTANRCHDGFE